MVTSKVRIVHGDGEHAQYLPEISRTCPGVPVLLVGTKSDVMMTGIGSGNYDPTWDWHDECTYTDKLVIMSDLSAHAHTPQVSWVHRLLSRSPSLPAYSKRNNIKSRP